MNVHSFQPWPHRHIHTPRSRSSNDNDGFLPPSKGTLRVTALGSQNTTWGENLRILTVGILQKLVPKSGSETKQNHGAHVFLEMSSKKIQTGSKCCELIRKKTCCWLLRFVSKKSKWNEHLRNAKVSIFPSNTKIVCCHSQHKHISKKSTQKPSCRTSPKPSREIFWGIFRHCPLRRCAILSAWLMMRMVSCKFCHAC